MKTRKMRPLINKIQDGLQMDTLKNFGCRSTYSLATRSVSIRILIAMVVEFGLLLAINETRDTIFWVLLNLQVASLPLQGWSYLMVE